jgi:membrane-associated protease RseP (regulator of RpoE activity)
LESTRSNPLEPVAAPSPRTVAAARRREAVRAWRWPVVLFAATLVSTLIVGGHLAGSPYEIFDLPDLLRDPELLWAQFGVGMPFALSLLAILLAHEFGHFFTARAHGVHASPPYFIPFPSIIGTMGAVIRMRGAIPTRAALVDIGASGPIAGFLVAVPLLVAGLALSEVHPLDGPAPRAISLLGFIELFRETPALAGGFLEGNSLLYLAAKRLAVGPIPEGHDVWLHPVALAAWFGLFVTALNLLPVGQLDGGHVLYAVLGRRAQWVGRAVVVMLVVLGVFSFLGWLVWALLAWKVIRTTHPPVVYPHVPLDRPRTWVAWVSLAMFVVTFVPLPLRIF